MGVGDGASTHALAGTWCKKSALPLRHPRCPDGESEPHALSATGIPPRSPRLQTRVAHLSELLACKLDHLRLTLPAHEQLTVVELLPSVPSLLPFFAQRSVAMHHARVHDTTRVHAHMQAIAKAFFQLITV